MNQIARYKKVVCAVAVGLPLLLSGCISTSTYERPPVVESPRTGGTSAPKVEPTRPADGTQEASSPSAPPVEQQPLVNPAVLSLINQSNAQLNNRDYSAAIATAERGLRIDRRAPELYLVLAKGYLAQQQPTQAKQFAQQGLRFAAANSQTAAALQQVFDLAN